MRHANATIVLGLGLVLAGCGGSEEKGFAVDPPVGKHVLYVADTDGVTSNTQPKDELYLADTGITDGARRIPVAVPDGGMIRLGPADAEHLSYLVADDDDGCDADWRVERRARAGDASAFLRGCVSDIAQSRSTGRIVFAWSDSEDLGGGYRAASAHLSDPAPIVYSIDPSTTVAQRSVRRATIAESGTVGGWSYEGGTGVTPLQGAGLTGTDGPRLVVDSEIARTLRFSADGSRLVYSDAAALRLKTSAIAATTATSGTYLTAALAGGAFIDDSTFQVTPDGSRVVYARYVAGAWELRVVQVADPASDQRLDPPAAPLAGPSYPDFALSPDGTRVAYFGVDGSGGPVRVFMATLAAPGTALALSPAVERPMTQVAWVDDAVVAYNALDGGNAQPFPSQPRYVLRTVAIATPGVSVALSPQGVPGGVFSFEVCADGTLVYMHADIEDLAIPEASPNSTQLFSATPMVAASIRPLSPKYVRPDNGIGDYKCLP